MSQNARTSATFRDMQNVVEHGLGNRRSILLSYGGNGCFPRFLRVSGQRRTREGREKVRFMSAQDTAQSVRDAFPDQDDMAGWVDLWCREDTGNIDCVPPPLRHHVEHMVGEDGYLRNPNFVPRSPYVLARWSQIDPKPPWTGSGLAPETIRKEYERRSSDLPEALIAAPAKPGSGDLYFIGSSNGPVKIGLSNDVAKRLQALQTASPYALEVLCIVKDKGWLEGRYHRWFADFRLQGEWFFANDKLDRTIARLNASLHPTADRDTVEKVIAWKEGVV